MAFDFDLLRRLSETPGIAGQEDQVRSLVAAEMRPLVDEISIDALGNVIGRKRGSATNATQRRVMISAHMDEIGFIVRYVDDDGFLRLNPVGGFDPRVLFAQRVIVHASVGEPLRGVLSTAGKPIHLLDREDIKNAKIDDYFVDTGLPGDRVKALVEIGDMVTLDRTAHRVGELVIGKAMDDRVGVFVMIEALRRVGNHEVDIVAVASVQEEVGLRGAGTSAFAVEPDVGIALDVTLAVDIPGVGKEAAVTRLGAGAAIGVMNSSVISNTKLVRHFREIARREKIAYQMEIMPRGGTDAGAIQRARGGVAALTLSVPTRYVHTVNEMVHPADVEACADLLARYLEEAHTRGYEF